MRLVESRSLLFDCLAATVDEIYNKRERLNRQSSLVVQFTVIIIESLQ